MVVHTNEPREDERKRGKKVTGKKKENVAIGKGNRNYITGVVEIRKKTVI